MGFILNVIFCFLVGLLVYAGYVYTTFIIDTIDYRKEIYSDKLKSSMTFKSLHEFKTKF